MINTNIIKKSGLKTLNAWRVKIGSDKFIITPAHNIIYRPTGSNTFKPSPFVPVRFDTDWYVPEQYIKSSKYNLLNDLAWKPIGKNSQTIQSGFVDSTHIYKTNYFYFQPYDYGGFKVSQSNYSLGCGQTVIYKSPWNNNKNAEYFEAIGMGFRGMSGAAITNLKSDKFLGLFIRKIGNLGTNLSDSTIQTETTGVSRGFIIPIHQIKKLIYSSKSIKIL
jgi:hypothetical protein